MTIDIILITYNQQNYIARAVDSILCQKTDNNLSVRLIVADDVSTDNTLSIIKEKLSFADMEYLYLAKEKNIGYIQNYKQAFAACSSDYVAILEGDDYWLDRHLAQHIAFLECHKECSMSMNAHHRLMPDGSIYEASWWGESEFRQVTLKEQLGSGNQLGNLSACVFRGSLIKQLPASFFDLNMADWELGVFMAQFGDLAILKEPTSVYRISEKGQWAGLSAKEKKNSLIADLKAMDKFFEYKYHSFCKKYQFKVLHPHLQKIKHTCGVAIRKAIK